jgi:hypothetical protein
MTQESELALSQECEEMNSEGKIKDLTLELGRLTKELSNIRDSRATKSKADRVHEIQLRIHDITERSRSILRPDWTSNKWPYSVSWDIKFSEFLKIDPRIIETNFEFVDFELEGLTIEGREREELYPLVGVDVQSQVIHVFIEKKATTLELCQMQSTLAISGNVRFKFQTEIYEDHLDLTMRPGAIRPPPPTEPEPIIIFPQPPKPTIPAIDEHFICKILNNCKVPKPFHWPIPEFLPKNPHPLPIPAVDAVKPFEGDLP